MRPRRSSTAPRACSSRNTLFTVAREVPASSASCSWVSAISPSGRGVAAAQLDEPSQHAPLDGDVQRLEQQLVLAAHLRREETDQYPIDVRVLLRSRWNSLW